MESRKIGSFIQKILADLDLLRNLKADYDLITNIESERAFQALLTLLNTMHKSHLAEQTLDEVSIQPLVDFIHARWAKVKKTNAMFMCTPKSRINLALFKVAEHLLIISNKHSIYEMLIPHFSCKDFYFPQRGGDLSLLRPDEFIWSDNDEPIDVIQTLTMSQNMERIRHDKNLLRQSSKTQRIVDITLCEQNRLHHHSESTRIFFLMESHRTAEEHKLNLKKAYESASYKVTTSYGAEGQKKLMKYSILENIHRAEDLIALMINQKCLTKGKQWQLFLKEIKNEDLFRIMLGLNTTDIAQVEFAFNERMAGNINWPGTDMGIRALSLCYNEVYKRTRTVGEPYKSTSGRFFGSWLYGSSTYEQPVKLESSDIYADLLISEHPLYDLSGFLKQYTKPADDPEKLTPRKPSSPREDYHTKYLGPLTSISYVAQYSNSPTCLLPKLVMKSAEAFEKIHPKTAITVTMK